MLRKRPAIATGFTIIELLVVVMVLAVLATLAAPSFQTFMATQQLKTASFDLYSSLVFARTEAIKYSSGVVRIESVNSDWSQGWTVSYVPTTGIANATVLRRREASPRVSISEAGSNTFFEFRRNGRPTTAISLSLTVNGHSEIQGRCVFADPSGNPFTKLRPSGGC
jgi:type IV fimbrial biogenesis protein FimT